LNTGALILLRIADYKTDVGLYLTKPKRKNDQLCSSETDDKERKKGRRATNPKVDKRRVTKRLKPRCQRPPSGDGVPILASPDSVECLNVSHVPVVVVG
jgi:hypothetical protein